MSTLDATDVPLMTGGRWRAELGALIRDMRRDRVVLLASVFLLALVIVALLAPQLSPSDPVTVQLENRLAPPVWDGGSLAHPLGADALGRDVLSRLMHGARVSLGIGVAVVVVTLLVGTSIGLYAGYHGGWRDSVLMRLADAQLAFPGLLLVIAVIAALGQGVGVIILVLTLYGWMIYARLVRGLALQLKEELYVIAAQLGGVSNFRIITRHLFPGLVAPLATQSLLELSRIILVESALSYLGLGIQPPNASWGLMVAENQQYMATAWWTVFFPGVAISLTVLCLNLVSNWLRQRMDVSRQHVPIEARSS